VNDPRLIHWFCENHDLDHAKLSTLPTGLTIEGHDEAVKFIPTNITLLNTRPLKILVRVCFTFIFVCVLHSKRRKLGLHCAVFSFAYLLRPLLHAYCTVSVVINTPLPTHTLPWYRCRTACARAPGSGPLGSTWRRCATRCPPTAPGPAPTCSRASGTRPSSIWSPLCPSSPARTAEVSSLAVVMYGVFPVWVCVRSWVSPSLRELRWVRISSHTLLFPVPV
jgi:hypothetical protein